MDLIELKRNAIDDDKHPAYIMDFEGEIWVAVLKDEFDVLRGMLE